MRRVINRLFDAFWPREPGKPDLTPFAHKVLSLALFAAFVVYCVFLR